jgi:porphobilinogen synthase
MMDLRNRPRRLRKNEAIRSMVRETRLHRTDLIYPLFVVPGSNVKNEISSMKDQYQLSADKLVEEAQAAFDDGVSAVILFGIPEHKDPQGSEAWKADGVVQHGIELIKKAVPDMWVITDVCMCEYTDHGHCGEIDPNTNEILNDPSLDLLAREAVSHANAGADMVAPSDMMDGRVGAIRTALDDAGHTNLPIMSYAVKYSSAFYGPFRDAAESAPQFGDRKSYQMDPANALEALREVALDIEEGADIVMVKPAQSYMDIIWRVRQEVDCPVAGYHVSGEYAQIIAAAERGWIELDRAMMEALVGIRRAGADLILTYYARAAARNLS